MCGRYVSVRSDADLLDEFEAIDATGDSPDSPYEPDYNVAPTKPVRIVVNRRQRDEQGSASGAPVRQLRIVSWGLVPSWAKDRSIGARMINARSETLATASAFRRAYAARRCLVPADGWYEWRAGAGAGAGGKVRKQPYFMTPTDGHGLAFAGLYEFWGQPGELLTTCTIVTAAAQGSLAEVHDRMPLVLPASSWSRWLDPAVTDPADLLEPWDEAGGEHLELRPVAAKVGDYHNNGPDLVAFAEVQPEVEPQALF
jgi:putative SOS response-associated peptidase YedK